MDEYHTAARRYRAREIKSHAVAFLMLGLSLFALYTHTLYLAIIPLLWMAFRAGKEQGREEAQKDMEQASTLARMIQFPEKETPPGYAPKAAARFRQFPQH